MSQENVETVRCRAMRRSTAATSTHTALMPPDNRVRTPTCYVHGLHLSRATRGCRHCWENMLDEFADSASSRRSSSTLGDLMVAFFARPRPGRGKRPHPSRTDGLLRGPVAATGNVRLVLQLRTRAEALEAAGLSEQRHPSYSPGDVAGERGGVQRLIETWNAGDIESLL